MVGSTPFSAKVDSGALIPLVCSKSMISGHLIYDPKHLRAVFDEVTN